MSLRDFFNAVDIVARAPTEEEIDFGFVTPYLVHLSNVLEREGAIYETDNPDPDRKKRNSLKMTSYVESF